MGGILEGFSSHGIHRSISDCSFGLSRGVSSEDRYPPCLTCPSFPLYDNDCEDRSVSQEIATKRRCHGVKHQVGILASCIKGVGELAARVRG
jgi:hypothetical protein